MVIVILGSLFLFYLFHFIETFSTAFPRIFFLLYGNTSMTTKNSLSSSSPFSSVISIEYCQAYRDLRVGNRFSFYQQTASIIYSFSFFDGSTLSSNYSTHSSILQFMKIVSQSGVDFVDSSYITLMIISLLSSSFLLPCLSAQ